MASIVYQITMGTGLALSVDGNNPNPGGQLILNNSDPKNPLQIWSPVFYPPTQANILFHPQTGLYAAPTALNKGAPVVLFKTPANPSFNGANTWQIVSSGPFVVRPPANTDLNLNALGSSWPVGTKIGIWSWGGGTPNEVWNFTPHFA
jgi:hypothetical protein